MNDIDKQKHGYLKVDLDYAPTTNGKKFAKWCEEHGFTPLNGGRRAWSSSLSTYLRDASGVAYADGEPFLFYEEDLVDTEAIISTAVREARIDEIKRYREAMTFAHITPSIYAAERIPELLNEEQL